MKSILIFVTSLDGKVTKWGEPLVRSRSSHQDQEYYKKIWDESRSAGGSRLPLFRKIAFAKTAEIFP
jgi:hypothetical protein